MKIRWKITLASLVAGVIPFVCGMVLISISARRTSVQQTQAIMGRYVSSINSGLEAFFTTAKSVALSSASLQGVRDMDWARTKGNFQGFVNANPTIHMMSLVNSEGYVYESNSNGNPWQGGRRTENAVTSNLGMSKTFWLRRRSMSTTRLSTNSWSTIIMRSLLSSSM